METITPPFRREMVHTHTLLFPNMAPLPFSLLQSALEYLKTRPHYRSAYYESGYPDDGFGVCTDVVAFGLLGAGYDLSQLVDEDIRSHPSDYDVPQRDRNIDFRRVRNLLVYFRHTAEELSEDPLDIEEWQGGDIVVFRFNV